MTKLPGPYPCVWQRRDPQSSRPPQSGLLPAWRGRGTSRRLVEGAARNAEADAVNDLVAEAGEAVAAGHGSLSHRASGRPLHRLTAVPSPATRGRTPYCRRPDCFSPLPAQIPQPHQSLTRNRRKLIPVPPRRPHNPPALTVNAVHGRGAGECDGWRGGRASRDDNGVAGH